MSHDAAAQHTHAPPSPLAAALADIKLAHTVFALPFALLAAVLAFPPGVTAPRIVGLLTLVTICMVFARTWAMLVNRLADRRFDADNPRTAKRAIPAGRLSPKAALALTATSAAAFVATTALFWPLFDNPWPLALSLPVLAWIAFYSFTKRFTALCHIALGSALALSPLAAAIAVNPDLLLTADPPPTALTLYALAAFVLAWVAGFDVAYALQDLDFDRSARLRSAPAALGVRGAIWASRLLHLAALAALALAWRLEPRFNAIALAGVALVATTLIAEHAVLARRGVAGLPFAFFTANGIVSLGLAATGITDALL